MRKRMETRNWMPGTRGTERTEELRIPLTALRWEAAELDLPILEAWAAQGDLDSLRELWRRYAQGAGGAARDPGRAFWCLVQVVDAGDYTELCELGRAYEEGIPGTVKADAAMAARIYRRGALAGDRRCREALARLQAARTEAA